MAESAAAPAEPVNPIADELEKLGYSMVKEGACNVPGYRKIQTWIKRNGTVYLLWNEAGQWDLIRSVFSGDPAAKDIAGALEAV